MPEAGKAIDPAGQSGQRTEAGRALQKHGGNGAFPEAKGSVRDVNAQGQQQLEDILTDPEEEMIERPWK